MKNQPVFSNSGTIEDLVFENRNRAYGAYDMNQKCRKYLIIAFFISLLGVSSAVAVPFFKAIRGGLNFTELNSNVTAVLTDVNNDVEPPPVPLPPPPPKSIVKQISFEPPIIVEDAPPDVEMKVMGDIVVNFKNEPPPEVINIADNKNIEIDESETEPILNPEEPATFRNGGLEAFRTWVIENLNYPKEAIDNNIFGRVVVTFCVNARGEVVDVKVLRSIHRSLDNEAVRVISSSPSWIAPKQGGTPVKQLFVLPVDFRMSVQ